MNIGKPVLDAIGATWDFSAPKININGQLIDLVENREDEYRASICQVKLFEDKERKINFYTKETIFVQPIVPHISNSNFRSITATNFKIMFVSFRMKNLHIQRNFL